MPGRFGPSRRPVWLAAAVLAALLAARVWYDRREPQRPEVLAEGTYQVARVTDGDTLVLTNEARVRLIGVDTPELSGPHTAEEPLGRQAKAFTEQFLIGGEALLRFDRERVDRYDRFLAYVYVEDRLLNEELVRAGLARARTEFRYSESMKRRFRRAEQEARAARLGIWSAENDRADR